MSTSIIFLISIIVISALVFVSYIFILWRQPPYKVVLSKHKFQTVIWTLKFRDGIFGEWITVFESPNKQDVQTKAREALFAHYRFKDFINGCGNSELIRDAEVVDELKTLDK